MPGSRLPTIRRVLRDHRRGFFLWSLALAAVVIFYLAFYPLMGDEMAAAIEGMPQGLMAALGYDRIGAAAGYLEAIVYGLLGPVLLLVYGIGLGGRLIAGEEESGTLELDLTAPISRARLYGERLAALWLLVGGLVAVVTAAVLLAIPLFDLGVAVGNVLGTSFGLGLLVGGFATVAFALGAASGRRSLALGGAAGLTVVGYVFRGVANAAGIDTLAALSPFAWLLAGDPLVTGLGVVAALKLAAIPAIAGPLGLWRFCRRDLMV